MQPHDRVGIECKKERSLTKGCKKMRKQPEKCEKSQVS